MNRRITIKNCKELLLKFKKSYLNENYKKLVKNDTKQDNGYNAMELMILL